MPSFGAYIPSELATPNCVRTRMNTVLSVQWTLVNSALGLTRPKTQVTPLVELVKLVRGMSICPNSSSGQDTLRVGRRLQSSSQGTSRAPQCPSQSQKVCWAHVGFDRLLVS
jgi:hypothetical protein